MKRWVNCTRIVFVSNYFNHHQKPFCEEMYKRLGDGFVFVSTSVMREERKKLGYSQESVPEYVILSYEGEEQRRKGLSFIADADVVIAGSAPEDMLLDRIRAGKLLLRYSERIYKKKVSFIKRVYHFVSFRKRDMRKDNIYILCAGAYVACDLSSIGMYKNRTYKWGYFPQVKKYDVDSLLSQKKRNVIMWCGRFIDWKHPDDAVMLAKKLKESGYDFHLNMIGTGYMEEELRNLVADFGLQDCVHFLGSMSPEQVRIFMEEAGIYLFTSDRQEGWGAVLNESMNSGCAVVASHAIGSVPFLIRDQENGTVYESGNVEMLFESVKNLLDYAEMQNRLGRAAYKTIISEWNAEIAADRLLVLVDALLKGKETSYLYETGVCSKAELVCDDWLKE